MAQMTEVGEAQIDHGLPPWQFFLLCGMLGATAVVIVATGQSIANILILSATIVVGQLRRVSAPTGRWCRWCRPTVARRARGGRRPDARRLEREKSLVLRAIKELEFDFAMGKVAQADFDEMGGRLRLRAMGLIQQLDATSGYREQIERELASVGGQ